MKNCLFPSVLLVLLLISTGYSDIFTVPKDCLLSDKNKGDNLALRKEVYCSVYPEIPADAEKGSKLTDGKIVSDNKITFAHPDTCGWQYNGFGLSSRIGVNMVIDLGSKTNLHSTKIRILNPSAQMVWWRLPKEITVVVSNNGRDFYKVKTYKKFLTYGKDSYSDAVPFFIEERNREFFYPFCFDLRGIKARYVGLHIVPESFIFWADEWQIFEDKNWFPTNRNKQIYTSDNRIHFDIDSRQSEKYASADDVRFGPSKDHLCIPANMDLPQYFHFLDLRPQSDDKLNFIMELPAEIELVKTDNLSGHHIKKEKFFYDGNDYNRYILRINKDKQNTVSRLMGNRAWSTARQIGAIFLRTEKKLAGEKKAVFYCEANDKKYTSVTVPVTSINIPAVQTRFHFPVGLSWLVHSDREAWPDFFENYKKLGFNNVRVTAGYVDLDKKRIKDKYKEFVNQARRNNLDIVLVDAGTSRLHKYEPVTKCNPELPFLCPSYFGQHYDQMLRELQAASDILNPDYLWWNIEAYAFAYLRKGCPRCEAGIKKSGLERMDYFKSCGTKILTDMYKAVDGDSLKGVGMYDLWPTAGGRLEAHGMHDATTLNQMGHLKWYHEVFYFEDAYPQALNIAMPHLYCAGLVDVLHTHMARPALKLMDKPWRHVNVLSTGTFGEFPSFKVEQMIYEQVLNSGGIDFYHLKDFNTVLDFYYFARALNTLEKYNQLLKSGRTRLDVSYTNDRLYYTLFENDNEALLLTGNYTSCDTEKTRVFLPFENAEKFLDVLEDKTLEYKETYKFDVKPQTVKLFYIQKERR